MNRRRFLELLGTAAAASGVVYSFPSVIVPQNIAKAEPLHPTLNPWTTMVTPRNDYDIRGADDMIYCKSNCTLTLPPSAVGGQLVYIVPSLGVTVSVLGQQVSQATVAVSDGQRWWLMK